MVLPAGSTRFITNLPFRATRRLERMSNVFYKITILKLLEIPLGKRVLFFEEYCAQIEVNSHKKNLWTGPKQLQDQLFRIAFQKGVILKFLVNYEVCTTLSNIYDRTSLPKKLNHYLFSQKSSVRDVLQCLECTSEEYFARGQRYSQ